MCINGQLGYAKAKLGGWSDEIEIKDTVAQLISIIKDPDYVTQYRAFLQLVNLEVSV